MKPDHLEVENRIIKRIVDTYAHSGLPPGFDDIKYPATLRKYARIASGSIPIGCVSASEYQRSQRIRELAEQA